MVWLLANAGHSIAACNIANGNAYGDCANVQVNTGSKKHLKVRGHASESRTIEGATVFSGASLALSGVSNSDITVNKGGALHVSGVVNGAIKNLGGVVEIEGSVQEVQTTGGRVVIGGIVGTVTGTGAVTYKKGAVIGGVLTERTRQVGAKQ